MAEKSALAQAVQVGVETTPGTGVSANKLLQSLSINPGVKAEIDSFRPTGYKYPTIAVPNKEWTEASLEGKATYTELIYPLSSILGTATVTTPAGTVKLWTFNPASVGADTAKTFTVETGEAGAGNANKFVGAIVNELELGFSRAGVEMSGSMMGQLFSTGQTLTAAPTAIALKPIVPGHVSVYLDPTAAALGSTKLTRAFEVKSKLSDRFKAVWPLDSANTSYAATVESEPKGEVTLKMAADAVGMGLLTQMRIGDSRFMRIKCTSTEAIETTYYYEAKFDFCLKVTGVSEFSDEDGIYAIEYTFGIFHDGTWGKAMLATVQNAIATL